MIAEGQQVSGYTVLRRLGRGGMGEVYLGQHRRVSRQAAIKVLVPELSQNQAVLERFFNEARATSLIKHPGIVEILDCDVLDGQAFIIMEYLDGESLAGYLNRVGALASDLPILIGMTAASASAVGAAHALGIVHRDLKPDNIYLHFAGSAVQAVTTKILDFGIAKLAQQEGSAGNQTKTGMLLGTPTYMSPEQCRGAARVDGRSDIYALGCILYEGITGKPPFVRDGMGDLIIAHVSETPEPPARKVAGLMPSLNSLVLRMLAKKAEDRPQTMEEVVEALRACARELGVNVDAPLRPRVPVERPPASPEGVPSQLSGASRPGTTPIGLRGSGPVAGESGSVPHRGTTPMPSYRPPSQSGRVGSAPGTSDVGSARAGGTQVLVAKKPTTLGSSAAEIQAPVASSSGGRGKLIAIGGAAALAVGIAVVALTMRGGSKPAESSAARTAAHEARAEEPTAPTPPPVAPPAAEEPSAADEPPPPSAKPAAAVKLPEVVTLELPGLPPKTTVTLDDQPTTLPVKIRRGPEQHRIVVRSPGQKSRELTLDGTRDRVVDIVLEKESTKHAEAHTGTSHEKSPERESGHHAGSAATAAKPHPGAPEKKPGSDREAITDI